MKYGKEFQSILESSTFPDDWKHSAIEYGKLKKIIKDVVAELESMGLSPEVLNRLLVTDRTPGGSGGTTPEVASRSSGERDREPEFEFEFEDPSEFPADGAAILQPEVFVEELEDENRYRVRLRGREDSPARRPGSAAGTSPAPISVSDLMMQRTASATSSIETKPRLVRRGVKAEYILDGECCPSSILSSSNASFLPPIGRTGRHFRPCSV